MGSQLRHVFVLHNHPSGVGYAADQDLKWVLSFIRHLDELAPGVYTVEDFIVYAGRTTASYREAVETGSQIAAEELTDEEVRKVLRTEFALNHKV